MKTEGNKRMKEIQVNEKKCFKYKKNVDKIIRMKENS